MVICSPSRIQAAPSPATIRVWNGDQLSRSSRAGIVLRIAFAAARRHAHVASFRRALTRVGRATSCSIPTRRRTAIIA